MQDAPLIIIDSALFSLWINITDRTSYDKTGNVHGAKKPASRPVFKPR